jgi:phage shock protein C
MNRPKIYKSRENKVLSGVIAGFAESRNLNTTHLRMLFLFILLFVLLLADLFGVLVTMFLYLFLALALEAAPQNENQENDASEKVLIANRTNDREIIYLIVTAVFVGLGIFFVASSEGSMAGIIALPFFAAALITAPLAIYNTFKTAKIRKATARYKIDN